MAAKKRAADAVDTLLDPRRRERPEQRLPASTKPADHAALDARLAMILLAALAPRE